jgi:APA family basic amino acid/polyamine antiporter
VLKGIFRTKSVSEILASTEEPSSRLKRTLSARQLTLLGIGAIIGAGIGAAVGSAAAGGTDHAAAGPAVVLSFVLTAIACTFAALCYAEFASRVPVSGSAYTYSYASLGELIAWIIGWDLIIEYGIGNAAIAISWAGYFKQLLAGLGVQITDGLCLDDRSAAAAAAQVAAAREQGLDLSALSETVRTNAAVFENAPTLWGWHVVFNLPAFSIVALITIVLVRGVRESAWLNSAMVVLKLLIIAFFVLVGFCYVQPENWTPFAPGGFTGISQAAAIVFFAYIGFDAISTASEEAKNPQRDMPRAILWSLVICTAIYIVVGIVLTGLLPYGQLNTAEPLATAFQGLGMNWAVGVISLGAVFATTAVLLVFQLGQPRIFFSMARDGLLPAWAAKVHPRYGTPHITTILTGVVVALLSAVCNLDEIVQLTNIGTLFAFVLVCVGVTILRFTQPDAQAGFRVPGGAFLVPMLGVGSCLFLMFWLPPSSWWRFLGWLVLGLAVYFSYGYNHSRIGRRAGRPARPDLAQKVAAFGFLSLAVGLFVLPHDQGPRALLAAARDPGHGLHTAAAWGLWIALAGLLLGVGGSAVAGAKSDDDRAKEG